MGILGGLFGKSEDFPPLPDDSYAQSRIDEVRAELATLSSQTKDRLEIVPSEHAAYVFIGKPPKNFGLAWIHDGKVSNLAALADEKRLNPIKRERIDDALRGAYRECQDSERFTLSIDGETVVVTPSPALEKAVHRIIEESFA